MRGQIPIEKKESTIESQCPNTWNQFTTMLFKFVGTLHHLLQRSVQGLLTVLVYLAIAVAVANRLGWLDRWIWFIIEKEGTKLLNGAQVTIGSFVIDWSEILQGKVTMHASNAILHTPQRDEWRWDSPLLARIGKATVEANVLITVIHGVFLKREVPIEAYTVIVSDVQVFVERRNSVINVYLLNPTLKLPTPPYAKNLVDGDQGEGVAKSGSTVQNASTTIVASHSDTSDESRKTEATTFFDSKSSTNPLEDASSSENDNHNEQAKALVNEMLQAVQVLGGAAARGQLPGAIKQQGLELMGRLQGMQLREQQNLEDGIRVMQQVGKVAVESLQTAPQYILPQSNLNQEGGKSPPLIRIGRIVGNDLRIFTKDSWINASNCAEEYADSSNGSPTGTQNDSKPFNHGASTDVFSADSSNGAQGGSWNKPIYIEKMVLTSSELCPPMSMKDEDNLPAVFQSVDKIGEIIWRRLLAEIAKSNTGKLFSTAFGEIVSVMVANPHHTIPAQPTAGEPLPAPLPAN